MGGELVVLFWGDFVGVAGRLGRCTLSSSRFVWWHWCFVVPRCWLCFRCLLVVFLLFCGVCLSGVAFVRLYLGL